MYVYKKRFIERLQRNNLNIEFYDKMVELEFDGKKIMVYHGDDKTMLQNYISSKKYDIVLSGHTHQSIIETIDGVLHINPGSTSGIKDSKITDDLSVAFYNSKTDEAEILILT